jgi:hypothetical protein
MDFPVVTALIAPRPLLIISGQQDTIFPPDGYHQVFQRTKRIYDLYAGANSERIREVDDNVGHSDPPLFLREARQWMRRWLEGDPTPLREETNSPPKESAEDLACLAALPADAVNFKIQNQFTAAVSLKEPSSRAAWATRRADLLAQLKAKVFRWFPTATIPFATTVSTRNGGYMPKYCDYKEVTFQSEDGVRIRGQLLTPRNRSSNTPAPLLIYVKRAGDSIYFMDTDELLPLLGRCPVLILNPRFTEPSMSPSEYADVERTAVWVGRTIAAMQVWDILRGVSWAADEAKIAAASIALYGKGEMGILGLYAALFDPRIKQIVLNDPPASHWQRPALINVLRVTDIPEVAGALAPRRVVSLTQLPAAFDFTQRIYKLERVSDQFVQSGSLPEALEIWKEPLPGPSRTGASRTP